MSIESIQTIINENKSFLITSHVGLEGDSIGSQIAFYRLLCQMGKKAFILDADTPSKQYKFLPYIKEINTSLDKKFEYDTIVVIDCPVLERAGSVVKQFNDQKVLVNIDHHISNSYFGDINWVNPKASSCGEMIYNLFCLFKQPITKEVATLLYVAIMTDTGSFGYENTDANTHLIAMKLIERGLKPVDIHKRIYENKTFSEIRLLEKALSTLKKTHGEKITYLYVSKKMMLDTKCNMGVTEGFVNYARSIEGAKVSLLFVENPEESNRIHISLRSKGEYDVNKLASYFNGGGHRNAAGCVVEGNLKEVIDKVIDTLKKKI